MTVQESGEYTPEPAKPERYLSVPESAEYLGVAPRFIRRIRAEGRIPFYKFGAHVRFALSDLDAFIAAGRVEARRKTPDTDAEPES